MLELTPYSPLEILRQPPICRARRGTKTLPVREHSARVGRPILGLFAGLIVFEHLKRTAKAYAGRRYPDARQRERRYLFLALGVGAVAATMVGLIVYLVSRGAR